MFLVITASQMVLFPVYHIFYSFELTKKVKLITNCKYLIEFGIWVILVIICFTIAFHFNNLLKMLDFTASLFYILFGMIIPTIAYTYIYY